VCGGDVRCDIEDEFGVSFIEHMSSELVRVLYFQEQKFTRKYNLMEDVEDVSLCAIRPGTKLDMVV
jgi:hypothetical protein